MSVSAESLIRITLFAICILQANCTLETSSTKVYQDNNTIQSRNNLINETSQSEESLRSTITKNPDVDLNTLQLITKYGYFAENHVVETSDGYLLSIHRISCTTCFKRQTVFLQHGLLGSSSDFIISGPKRALAFILSDAGYDVWIGNFRGNTYSRAHINISTSNSKFWDFSWDEHAKFDLPAMINYVNRHTNNRVLYIGHSMGTTALFALLSSKPEYNKMIKAAFVLSPIAYMNSIKSPIRYIAPFVTSIEWITNFLGQHEFLPSNLLMKLFAKFCEINPLINNAICENILFLIFGYDAKQLRTDLIPVIFGHGPAGSSTKTIIHYAQEIRDFGNFQMYDHGPDKNMEKYGQLKPPHYDISNIDVPIAFFCSDNDWMSALSDAQRLYYKMRNPLKFFEISYRFFSHLDFLWGEDAPFLVYNELISLMDRFRS